jgi:N-dimethylarginine dimethylaminohydrolase
MPTNLLPPRLLMCPPDFYEVSYAINPWMDPEAWRRDGAKLHAESLYQWRALVAALETIGFDVMSLPPLPGAPDLVFTANAAVVLDGTVLVARFRNPERQVEEPHLNVCFAALAEEGYLRALAHLPDGVTLEGAGDCIWDATRQHFWMGYGQRSTPDAKPTVEATFGKPVIALELVDPRFYHLDTAFCPLPGGDVLYFPAAFSAAGIAAIRDAAGPDALIEASEADASALSVNAVSLDRSIVMAGPSERLQKQLAERGYTVVPVDLSAFTKSGGASFCLTLKLDQRSTS